MTFDEYNEKIEILFDEYREDYDEDKLEELIAFQYKHMREFVAEYKKKINCTARQVCFDVFENMVECSESGSSVVYLSDYTDNIKEQEKLAAEVEDMIWEDLGQYMLDAPEIYLDKFYGNGWIVDCMFGGYYCPGWDGYNEDWD